MSDSKKNKSILKKRFTKLALTAVIVCAAVLIDSKFRIQMKEYEIFSEMLPDGFDGYRVVQISDLHGMEFGNNNKRLIDAVTAQSPDMIALTGDFVEKRRDLFVLEELIAALSTIAPIYFVSGNHDWASGLINEISSIVDRYGAIYLKNEYLELEKNGDSIVLCGVEDPNSFKGLEPPDSLVSKLRDVYPDKFVLLLAHRNYWPERYLSLDVDTILCGHGHGGIIRIPFVGGLIGTGADFFPEYTSGAYVCIRYTMIVSRGLGDSPPLPRMLNNPHLPVIILRKG